MTSSILVAQLLLLYLRPTPFVSTTLRTTLASHRSRRYHHTLSSIDTPSRHNDCIIEREIILAVLGRKTLPGIDRDDYFGVPAPLAIPIFADDEKISTSQLCRADDDISCLFFILLICISTTSEISEQFNFTIF